MGTAESFPHFMDEFRNLHRRIMGCEEHAKDSGDATYLTYGLEPLLAYFTGQ